MAPNKDMKIVVEENGPYIVYGGVPLVRKRQVVSEHGEPLTWEKEGEIETPETYRLCRCGHSNDKPFCDTTHYDIDFDGTETADTDTYADRHYVIPGTRLVIRRDPSLCMSAGFCGNRIASIPELADGTDDSVVRAQVIAMIERCPSGSYSYSIEEAGPDIEPDLPAQIAVVTEITDDGPITGPLWVTGNIPIERADGQPLEIRNRVTLCGCGLSTIKPLCDGTHRHEAERLARARRGK